MINSRRSPADSAATSISNYQPSKIQGPAPTATHTCTATRQLSNQSQLIVSAATRERKNSSPSVQLGICRTHSKTATTIKSESGSQEQRSKIQSRHQLDNIRTSAGKQHQHSATLNRMQRHRYTSIIGATAIRNYHHFHEKSTSTLDSHLPD
ncbi:hypothetical protein Nepgr_001056 [Nepenthes gracilis]|uniref:Uncharacterized protein n=1 Tax=Nepenthes gracilis TaxID=150966 RepID=A0AAD3P4N2_NEPGR|nr:hypothetical protein Nepgr_001056 [Nepenthes gracilis]